MTLELERKKLEIKRKEDNKGGGGEKASSRALDSGAVPYEVTAEESAASAA